MDTQDKKRSDSSYWATATDSANLLLNVVGGVISFFITFGVAQWLRLEQQKWWFSVVIGFGMFLVLMFVGGWLRFKKMQLTSSEDGQQTINLNQSVNVGGNQLAPNIANAPHGQVNVNIVHDHGATAVQDAVSKGSAAQILEAFHPQQAALKSFDPLWVLDAHLSGNGGSAVSLQPRVPEAYHRSPITVHFAAQATKEFPDLASLLRHVYATGHPASVSARDIQVRVGPKPLMSMETGVVTIGIAEDAIEQSVIKLSVPEVGVSYDYIRLAIRTYDGVRYMDNKGQEDCPLLVSGEAEMNSDGKTMRFNLEMGLSPQGSRSAKQFVKLLTMLCALAEGHPIHLGNLVTEQAATLDRGNFVRAEELPELTAQLKWWSRVVDLERHLSLTFDIPDQISEDDFEAVEHLWALLVERKSEHQLPPMTFSVAIDMDTARKIASGMTDKGFAVGGECESEDLPVLGTTLRLPARRVMMSAFHLGNPEVVHQSTGDSSTSLTLLFSSNQPTTVVEEPLD